MGESSRTKATPPPSVHLPKPIPKRAAPTSIAQSSFELKLKAYRDADQAWDFFQKKAPSSLHYNSIPWPDGYGGVWSNVLGVPGNAPRREVKEAYKKLQLRWHPDRFISRYQGRFAPADAERIRKKCDAITANISLE
jgi:hypothetical protein